MRFRTFGAAPMLAALLALAACAEEAGRAFGGQTCLELLADAGADPFSLSREDVRVTPGLGEVTWFCEYAEGETDAPCPYEDAAIVAFADEVGTTFFAHYPASPIAPASEVFCVLSSPAP